MTVDKEVYKIQVSACEAHIVNLLQDNVEVLESCAEYLKGRVEEFKKGDNENVTQEVWVGRAVNDIENMLSNIKFSRIVSEVYRLSKAKAGLKE